MKGNDSLASARATASRNIYPVLSIALAIALWQTIILIFRPSDYVLPPPAIVAGTLVERFTYLLGHAWVTALEVVSGFALSVVIGVPIAVMIGSSTLIERLVFPLLVISQSVPMIALAPLLIVWLGFGIETKLVIVVLISFFPIVVNTVVGLKSVPADMLDLARTMGLSSSDLFFKIKLPHALPTIFAGLRVAATVSVVGAIVGEFVGANRGLGYLLLLASSQLQTALMFADIFLLIVISLTFFTFITTVERLLLPWHVSVRRESAATR